MHSVPIKVAFGAMMERKPPAHVRFGSKADIKAPSSDVRFTAKSGHWLSPLECPLCAKSRHSGCLLDPIIDLTTEQREINRLGQQSLGAAFQCLSLGLGITVSRNHNHWHVRPQSLGFW